MNDAAVRDAEIRRLNRADLQACVDLAADRIMADPRRSHYSCQGHRADKEAAG